MLSSMSGIRWLMALSGGRRSGTPPRMSLNSVRNFLRRESRPILFRRSITCSLGGYDFPVLTVTLGFVDPASDISRTVVAARALSEDVVSVDEPSLMRLRLLSCLALRVGDSLESPAASHRRVGFDCCGAFCGAATFEVTDSILAKTGSSVASGLVAAMRGGFLPATCCLGLRLVCVRDRVRFWVSPSPSSACSTAESICIV